MSDDFERDVEGEESENDLSDDEVLRQKSSLDDDFPESDEIGGEDIDPLAIDPLAEDEPESLDKLEEEEMDEEDEWDDIEDDER